MAGSNPIVAFDLREGHAVVSRVFAALLKAKLAGSVEVLLGRLATIRLV